MSIDLVTGGGGFIGSHLVDALLRLDRTLRVIDNFAAGRRQYLVQQVNSTALQRHNQRRSRSHYQDHEGYAAHVPSRSAGPHLLSPPLAR